MKEMEWSLVYLQENHPVKEQQQHGLNDSISKTKKHIFDEVFTKGIRNYVANIETQDAQRNNETSNPAK